MPDTIRTSVPGISRIMMIRAGIIPSDAVRRIEAGLPVSVGGDAIPVDFIGEARCTTEETHTRAGVSYTTELTFTTPGPIPAHPKDTAWVVFDREGNATVLGTYTPPVPRLKSESDSGLLSGRRAVGHTVSCITRPIPAETLLAEAASL